MRCSSCGPFSTATSKESERRTRWRGSRRICSRAQNARCCITEFRVVDALLARRRRLSSRRVYPSVMAEACTAPIRARLRSHMGRAYLLYCRRLDRSQRA